MAIFFDLDAVVIRIAVICDSRLVPSRGDVEAGDKSQSGPLDLSLFIPYYMTVTPRP